MDEPDRKSFLEQEYAALRNEIEQAQARAFKVFVASLLVIPVGETLAKAFGAEPLVKLSLPLILIAFYVVFRSQVLAAQRAGFYIRTHIEPRVEGGVGWETWLKDRRRTYDKRLSAVFSTLFAVYYLATIYVAATARLELDPYLNRLKGLLVGPGVSIAWLAAMIGFYLLLGILAVFLFERLAARTLRSEEENA